MSLFETQETGKYGNARVGRIQTRHGDVATPAFFPVVNFIGGTTPESGGIWSRTRNRLFAAENFQGAMFQSMSFLDFNITPDNLDTWRSKTLRDWFTDRKGRSNAIENVPDFTQPLFVDSGGYKLMNARTFGALPEAGGQENEWDIYTSPKSILELQLDYGADIVATLDYPIPPNLEDSERQKRREDSIESAKKTIEMIENEELPQLEKRDEPPGVYVAIHGYDYESVHWYVSRVLDEVGDNALFDGFALGSLVPVRSNIPILLDIVQGARNAIPAARRNELGLHVFGISGDLFGLLSLLGVDSFDSSSFVQAAQYKNFIKRKTWKRVDFEEVDSSWGCSCDACEKLDFEAMHETLNVKGRDYDDRNGFLKSDYYALIAMHNFHVFQDEIDRVRDCIRDDSETLLNYVVKQAQENPKIKQGLKRAQRQDRSISQALRSMDNDAANQFAIDSHSQTTLSVENDITSDGPPISLEHSAADFNVLEEDHSPIDCPVLLLLPCSDTKPYSESETHTRVRNALEGLSDQYYKVSVSGLFGPVPETLEERSPIMSYDYVLSDVDQNQQELVRERLTAYLDRYGEQFDAVIGYAASKVYRQVIADAVSQSQVDGILLPDDPNTRQLLAHFRQANLDQLRQEIESVVTDPESTRLAADQQTTTPTE